jgi:hypothetical protein
MPRGPAFARRKDGNHAEVRALYRSLGCYVKDIDFIADLFVIVPCDGVMPCRKCHRFFVEIKDGQKAKLTESELEWQLLLGDQFVIVRSLEDVRNSVK